MSIRSISINPSDLNIKTKKEKKKKSFLSEPITINTTNIRKLLLEKLKQHKKTHKNIILNQDTFDTKPPEYSNLKHGTKPTFRVWQKNINTPSDTTPSNELCILPYDEQSIQPISIQTMESTPATMESTPATMEYTPSPIVQTEPIESMDIFNLNEPYTQLREIKKTFHLGKNTKKKTISVLIKSNITRKEVDKTKTELKKTKLNTIKNYLKSKNLIKFGTNAPSGLLKEIYESSKLCGEIYNKNANTLIHNYNINNDSYDN
jgi:hypothetical protein